jgi:NAD(P)-dependent dehydrogenase (short-subunit alcohol dehydrogenase family)
MTVFDLSGKVALITGSSRGIGRAIALRMAEQGAEVVVSSRKLEACESVAAEIEAKGGQAMARVCDIADETALRPLVEAVIAAWGHIDVLVCNAAVNPHFGPTMDVSDAAFERTMNVNLRSNLRLCACTLPHMAAAGGGSVILISSIAAFRGQDKLGIYALSKAAEQQLARNIAVEWGSRNIRANCIAPGLVRTDFAQALWSDPDIYGKVIEHTPLRRIGDPDDIAGAAVFLASNAGAFTTGQTLIIDGGASVASF